MSPLAWLLPPQAPTPSTAPFIAKNSTQTPRLFSFYPPAPRKPREGPWACKASSSSSSSSVTDLDLYDLLGIDSSSDQSQIKLAYRKLQKRCHPDIAGRAGHDMAIILNEAYAVLSDPISRFAYDKEQEKITEFHGYTGKPIYSVWFGSENERRAVFVDEVKCIGCLKCALFAEKTFAIESVYGRARVVGQWADPEHKIQAAIETCPVDCISIVERSELPAMEFLMSKQPRGNVQVGAGNSAGAPVSDILVDAKRFQTRFFNKMNKVGAQDSQGKHSYARQHYWPRNIWDSKRTFEIDFQREARNSAVQAIRSISNWLYWQAPRSKSSTIESHQNLIQAAQKSTEPNIDKLQEVATRRRQAMESRRSIFQTPSNYIHYDEYWIPSTQALPTSNDSSGSKATLEALHALKFKDMNDEHHGMGENNHTNPIRWRIPLMTATMATIIVYLHKGQEAVAGLDEHMGGSLALEIVNSSWLHITLAWITWYLLGVAVVELVDYTRNRLL